ncbi:hypothetical protein SUGI_0299400 [Cryptomeria japonica]|nr:hypothetical protein SUGI_0299400 [Cryptomeria japonica]
MLFRRKRSKEEEKFCFESVLFFLGICTQLESLPFAGMTDWSLCYVFSIKVVQCLPWFLQVLCRDDKEPVVIACSGLSGLFLSHNWSYFAVDYLHFFFTGLFLHICI